MVKQNNSPDCEEGAMSDNLKSAIEFKVRVIVESCESGCHAYCPALKGLYACGDTEEEALIKATSAAQEYLSYLIREHEPIPVDIIADGEVESIIPPGLRNTVHHYVKDLLVISN
jgi:predicted RNase H-like HicB family nuclease